MVAEQKQLKAAESDQRALELEQLKVGVLYLPFSSLKHTIDRIPN